MDKVFLAILFVALSLLIGLLVFLALLQPLRFAASDLPLLNLLSGGLSQLADLAAS